MSEGVHENQAMGRVTLTIDLEAGFNEDTVNIYVNRERVAYSEGVTTDYSVGLAGSVLVDVPPGLITLELSVPKRQISHTLDLEVGQGTSVRASISPQGELSINVRPAEQPREYF